MAYTRKNRLQRIVDIQQKTLEYTAQGVTQRYIYEKYIYPTYRISQSAYYNYLSIPAARELKRMEETKALQTELFG